MYTLNEIALYAFAFMGANDILKRIIGSIAINNRAIRRSVIKKLEQKIETLKAMDENS